MSFETAHPALQQALTQRGYTTATPVQAAVLVEAATDHDLLVSAQTGSGKTVAFGIAMAASLLGDEPRFGPAGAPLGLVVAPTRELAMQVQTELTWLFAPAGGRVIACVGGMDVRREARALAAGAHIVVGTPGRLADHLNRGRLVLGKVGAVVLDEADEMLDMGFRDELELVLGQTPAERRTLLFSATLPAGILSLAARYQRDAVRIAATPPGSAHADITWHAVLIAPREREHAVVNVLRFLDAPGALVFCATREGVYHLHANLVERGFPAVALSGELSQAERNRALQALRDGRARVGVATDVAARGLDLPDLGLVIHADLPHDAQVLLHRSGRTGRAGRKGTCALLVPVNRRRIAERLLHEARVDAKWSAPPTAEAVRKKDRERLLTALAAPIDDDDRTEAESLLAESTPLALAAAFLRLQHGSLPEPEELPETASLGRPTASSIPAPPPAARHGGRVVWFHMNVGRAGRADPKWLIPLICRRGGVSKGDIGEIQIFREETRFSIAEGIARAFEDAARRPDVRDPRIRIGVVRN